MKANPGPQSPSGNSDASVYFVADAHLGIESSEREEAKERDLVALLDYLEGRASHLYIAGDLFDFWFEYPTVTPHAHFTVLKALSGLSASGTEIHFLGGNHDYWAGDQLESMTGATVHRDPIDAEHFGKRIFVAHGDGLPAGDSGYRALKAILRSRPAIAAFRLLHPTVGAAMARWASGLSEVTPDRIDRAVPAMREFLERKLSEGYDAAVVGHIHKQFMWKSGKGTAVVVGDWMWNRNVVAMTADGFRLMSWKDAALVNSDVKTGSGTP